MLLPINRSKKKYAIKFYLIRYLLFDRLSHVCQVSINTLCDETLGSRTLHRYSDWSHDCIWRSIHSGHNLISILTSITLQRGYLMRFLMRSYHKGMKLASSKWISRTQVSPLLFPKGFATNNRPNKIAIQYLILITHANVINRT